MRLAQALALCTIASQSYYISRIGRAAVAAASCTRGAGGGLPLRRLLPLPQRRAARLTNQLPSSPFPAPPLMTLLSLLQSMLQAVLDYKAAAPTRPAPQWDESQAAAVLVPILRRSSTTAAAMAARLVTELGVQGGSMVAGRKACRQSRQGRRANRQVATLSLSPECMLDTRVFRKPAQAQASRCFVDNLHLAGALALALLIFLILLLPPVPLPMALLQKPRPSRRWQPCPPSCCAAAMLGTYWP